MVTSLDQLMNEREKIKEGLKINLVTILIGATMLSLLEITSSLEKDNLAKYVGYFCAYFPLVIGSSLETRRLYELIRNSFKIRSYN